MSEKTSYNALEPSSEERGKGSTPRNSDLLRAFTAISRAFNLGQPLSVTLDLVAEKVSQTMGHKYCAIYLLEGETGKLLMEGSYGLSEEYVRALNTNLVQKVEGDDARANSVSAMAFKTETPIHVKDITSDPRFKLWREAALKAGYSSVVSLPLIFDCEPIGVLNCYDEPRSYSEEQVEALVAVAEQAASAVGIARLMLEQQQSIDQLNELNERLNSLNRHVTAQHNLLQRSEEIHNTLTAILLEDCSLHDITEALSEVLQQSVVLQDDKLHVLSQYTGSDKSHSSISPDEKKRLLLDKADNTTRSKVERKLESSADDDSSTTQVATRIVAGGELYGYLSVELEGGSEEDLYLRALEQAATVYALYMMKERVALESEGRTRGDLLADLLIRRYNEDDLRRWSRYLWLDFDSARPHRILAIKSDFSHSERGTQNTRTIGKTRNKLVALARSFSSRFDFGAAVALGDYVVVLVSDKESMTPNGIVKHLLELIHKEIPEVEVRVGVSAVCRRPLDFAQRYEQTVSLVDLADRLEATTQVVCYDDWKIYGLLLNAGNQDDMRNLVHDTLTPILQQDQGEQLLTTLEVYFDNDLNMSQAASVLHVHPNTVKYRLRRISELLSVDLGELDEILTLKIALMVGSLNSDDFNATNPQRDK